MQMQISDLFSVFQGARALLQAAVGWGWERGGRTGRFLFVHALPHTVERRGNHGGLGEAQHSLHRLLDPWLQLVQLPFGQRHRGWRPKSLRSHLQRNQARKPQVNTKKKGSFHPRFGAFSHETES